LQAPPKLAAKCRPEGVKACLIGGHAPGRNRLQRVQSGRERQGMTLDDECAKTARDSCALLQLGGSGHVRTIRG
jgi:hypothetical protein